MNNAIQTGGGCRLVGRFLFTSSSSTKCPTLNSAFSSPRLLLTRAFLSDAHQCDESWEKVLAHSLSFNADSYEKYSIFLLDKSNRGFPNTAVELDTLAHKLQDVVDLASIDIFEPLLNGVRASERAADLHWGTSHALVRGYLDMNLAGRLVDKLLPAKLEYGVFLDGYSAAFLLNELMLKGDWTRGCKVAEDLMRQECFFSPLLRRMCMLSVMKHVDAGAADDRQAAWEAAEEEERDRLASEEEVLEYYHYRPNGYHDGHFDLKSPAEIVGKTAMVLGREEGGDLGASFLLLGAGLTGEDKLVETLADFDVFDRKPASAVKDAVARRFEGNARVAERLDALKASTMTVVDCEAELTALIAEDAASDLDEFRGSYDALMAAWMEERRTAAETEHWANQEKELRRLASEQLKTLEKQEEVLTYFENEVKVELMSNLALKKAEEATVPVNAFERYRQSLHPDLIDHQRNMWKTWLPVPDRQASEGNQNSEELYHLADYYKKPWWSF